MLNIGCQVSLNQKDAGSLYNLIMTIGARIKQVRKENKLSQERFGELCDVTKSLVSQWENDKLIPNLERLLALKEKVNFSFDWVLTGKIEYHDHHRLSVNQPHAAYPPPGEEVELLLGFRAASEGDRELMLFTARRATDQQNFLKRNESN